MFHLFYLVSLAFVQFTDIKLILKTQFKSFGPPESGENMNHLRTDTGPGWVQSDLAQRLFQMIKINELNAWTYFC